ncbi:MAG TPA: amino acid adenylation domain-containing protein, partial [Herpetosiphonaceae bacterium]
MSSPMNSDQIVDIYPLSPMQQGMLFHTLYAPQSPIYVQQMHCTLHGDLDRKAFAHAWEQAIERYTVLRTVFLWEDLDEPMQIVLRRVDLPLEQLDWRSYGADEQQQRLGALLRADRDRGFDLSMPPLMRLALIRIAERAYYFVWSRHHIVLDGWSIALVLRDVFAHYEAFRQHQPIQAELPRPYGEYIGWLQRQDLAQAEAYWRTTLRGFHAPTMLCADQPTRPQPGHDDIWQTHHVELSGTTTMRLKGFARQHQLTLNTILQGSWAILLSRYSGEDDVVFGATVSGRPTDLPGIESMAGVFVNTLPVRARIAPDMSALAWLKQIQIEQAGARHYQYSPLAQIQQWSEVGRGALFESLLVVENHPLDALMQQGSGNLTIGDLQAFERTNYALTVMVVPGAKLTFEFWYEAHRFSQAMIARMAEQLQIVLTEIVTHPERRVPQMPIVTPGERQLLLTTWNQTARPVPEAQCLHHLIEAQAARSPDAVAVSFEDAHLTYVELNARANRLAHHLQALGIGPDACVGVCLDRSLDLVVALLAVLKAGAAYVPLDPAYPAARLAAMLADSRASVLVTRQHLAERLQAYAGPCVMLDRDLPAVARLPAHNPRSDTTPDNLAYVIYTSGSTGTPKGVAIPHRSVVAFLSWARTYFAPEQLRGVLAATSICFDLSIFELFLPLCTGGTTVLVENILHLPRLTDRSAITLINTVPSALAELLRSEPLPATLRIVNLAGEAVPRDLVQQLGQQPMIQQVVNLYGPTEDTVYSTVAILDRDIQGAPPIGRPIANTQVYLLDRRLHPVPVGVAGELYLGGAGLARGYLHRPDLTAARFLPDPFGQTGYPQGGARLYRTGDLARYRDDGVIEFLGRRDHQVKVRGFRIELGEIEAALRSHPAVREAVVLAREDAPGDRRLVAYVVTEEQRNKGTREQSEGQEPGAGNLELGTWNLELRAYLRERLPDYMVPSAFVVLDSLPRTPNGKLDRQALPPPDAERPALESAYIPAQTQLEREIAEVWQEVLRLDQVGIHDHFFDLGGHSLLMIQLHSKLRARLLADLTLVDLFRFPTISALAEHLSPASEEQRPSRPTALPSAAAPHERMDIAIIGMSGRFPGASSVEAFWENLRSGVESITVFSDDELL